MKSTFLVSILLIYSLAGLSQSVISPNYGLKSPATAEIVRVDFNDDATVVWLTIMSDIDNAWFCIDRNTFIILPDGTKARITGLKGLPYCPATYRFKHPGEKQSFSLTFPPTGLVPWFSIVEECAGGCLSVRGVLADKAMNEMLNEAYSLSDKGENIPAYRIFEDFITKTDSLNLGIEGAIFTSLIVLDRKMGREEAAKSWHDRLLTSRAPDLKLYLESLKLQGIEY